MNAMSGLIAVATIYFIGITSIYAGKILILVSLRWNLTSFYRKMRFMQTFDLLFDFFSSRDYASMPMCQWALWRLLHWGCTSKRIQMQLCATHYWWVSMSWWRWKMWQSKWCWMFWLQWERMLQCCWAFGRLQWIQLVNKSDIKWTNIYFPIIVPNLIWIC